MGFPRACGYQPELNCATKLKKEMRTCAGKPVVAETRQLGLGIIKVGQVVIEAVLETRENLQNETYRKALIQRLDKYK